MRGNSQTNRSDLGATVAALLLSAAPALGVSLATAPPTARSRTTFTAGTTLIERAGPSAPAARARPMQAVAGVGSLLAAGAGAEANATDSSNVSAVIRRGRPRQCRYGHHQGRGKASPDAKASAKGVAVAGGLAVGAAIANATVNPTVRAAIEGNASLPASQFTAGTLSVLATASVFGTTSRQTPSISTTTRVISARGGMSAWPGDQPAPASTMSPPSRETDAQGAQHQPVTASVGNGVDQRVDHALQQEAARGRTGGNCRAR